tara:strand:- start:438 stop:662 length:225 start_codon:yes stop_codon:yes gene_type:complete
LSKTYSKEIDPIKILIIDKLINLNKIVPIITPNKEYGAIDHKILYSKCFLFKNKAITSHTINIGINIAIAVKGP